MIKEGHELAVAWKISETMAIMERVGLVELLGRDSICLSTPRLN
jgi:hypothetical protein